MKENGRRIRNVPYIIRECRLEDAEAICGLSCSGLGYDFPLEETKKKLSDLMQSEKDKIFIAEAGDKSVGYIHANDYDVLYAPHMKNIMGIAVLPEYRKLGIGTSLLHAVEEWAKRTGAAGVRLVSGSSRTGAHEFYRHCGYGGEKEQINFKKIF